MRIQYENGTVICPQRKNVVANDSSFCKFCGDKLPKIDFEKYEWCPECAELVEKGLKNAVTADSYYIQFQRIWSSVPNAVSWLNEVIISAYFVRNRCLRRICLRYRKSASA